MLGAFGLANKGWAEIAAISDPFPKRSSWLGPSAHIQWDASGAVVVGFGKYHGTPVDQVEAGFLRWILAKDFPPHVKGICRAALEQSAQFRDWVTRHYPRLAAVAQSDAVLAEPFGQGKLGLEWPL
jgi:hypothetical protein